MRNPIAKNAWKANKSAVFKDRKKDASKRGCRKPAPRDGGSLVIYTIVPGESMESYVVQRAWEWCAL